MGAPDAAPQQLRDNWSILDDAEASTAKMLLDAGQEHLFTAWPAPGERNDDKKRLLAQVRPPQDAAAVTFDLSASRSVPVSVSCACLHGRRARTCARFASRLT